MYRVLRFQTSQLKKTEYKSSYRQGLRTSTTARLLRKNNFFYGWRGCGSRTFTPENREPRCVAGFWERVAVRRFRRIALQLCQVCSASLLGIWGHFCNSAPGLSLKKKTHRSHQTKPPRYPSKRCVGCALWPAAPMTGGCSGRTAFLPGAC